MTLSMWDNLCPCRSYFEVILNVMMLIAIKLSVDRMSVVGMSVAAPEICGASKFQDRHILITSLQDPLIGATTLSTTTLSIMTIGLPLKMLSSA
jgi:hypothetical protein